MCTGRKRTAKGTGVLGRIGRATDNDTPGWSLGSTDSMQRQKEGIKAHGTWNMMMRIMKGSSV
jgi:hypothetical protein